MDEGKGGRREKNHVWHRVCTYMNGKRREREKKNKVHEKEEMGSNLKGEEMKADTKRRKEGRKDGRKGRGKRK